MIIIPQTQSVVKQLLPLPAKVAPPQRHKTSAKCKLFKYTLQALKSDNALTVEKVWHDRTYKELALMRPADTDLIALNSADIATLQTSVDMLSPKSSPVKRYNQGQYEPMLAVKKLCKWLSVRLSCNIRNKSFSRTVEKPQVVGLFLLCLLRMFVPRIRKMGQIFVHAQPNSGKTTLYTLLTKLDRQKFFKLGYEQAQCFTIGGFTRRPENAVWVDDEFTGDRLAALNKSDFNQIVEGHYVGQVPVKNKEQRCIRWKGHVMLMGNYSVEQLFYNVKNPHEATVRQKEFEIRTIGFEMIDPLEGQLITTEEFDYEICHPAHLLQDINTLVKDMHKEREICSEQLYPLVKTFLAKV